jgi:hypothetical protein
MKRPTGFSAIATLNAASQFERAADGQRSSPYTRLSGLGG